MKVVILAGGYGTRISEETVVRPKPLVEVGGRPILWHIMKIYSYFGLNDFVICLGYKGHLIKEFFYNYSLYQSDVTFRMQTQDMVVHENHSEPWNVTLVDTGDKTMTGGRLKRVRHYLDDEAFCFTYGDGVGDVDIAALLDFHRTRGTWATLTAVQPPGRFGALDVENNLITRFQEKPDGDGGWINGGFFVLEPEIFDVIDGDDTVWEGEPLDKLARIGQLSAFQHRGFWQPLDTLRDKNRLEQLWQSPKAPWNVWS